MASNTKKSENSVLVIGGGLAGLCATIEAYRHGAQVTLIEKNPNLGGNSALASSGINLLNTNAQQRMHIEDSIELFSSDTLKSGKNSNVKSLVTILSNEAHDAATFLNELNVDVSEITQCGGHSVPRTHRAKAREDGKLENFGRTITQALIQHVLSLSEHGRVRIMTNMKAESFILNEEGSVVGVNCEVDVNHKKSTMDILVDCVILTTGGYAADKTLLEEFGVGNLSGLPTTNGPWAAGEGVKMGRKIGAELIDIDKVQIHPTGIIDPKDVYNLKKWLAPEAFRACGGILINHEGKRYSNELGTRDEVVAKIFANCKPIYPSMNGFQLEPPKEGERIPIVSYLIMNDEIAKQFDWKLFEFYKAKGFITSYSNAHALCETLGIPFDNFKNTIESYNPFVGNTEKKSDEFQKSVFPVAFDLNQSLHVVLTTPSIHYTMGGLRISNTCQVLKKDNTPIPGLFAAGEVSGGVHGSNRLAGNSLLECVVFGRRAGFNATQYIGHSQMHGFHGVPNFVDANGVTHRSVLSPTQFLPLRLQERFQLNKTSHVFKFALPQPTDQIGLHTGQYIAMRAKINGEDIVRYYSPISKNRDFGRIELLIKIEPEKMTDHSMTSYLSQLRPGDSIDIKGPMGGFEYHRNFYKNLGMIAGGTGISPMVQIIRSVVSHPEDQTQLHLLYGNYYEDDILCKDELMYWSATRSNVHTFITLNNPPPHWSMGEGFITEDMIKKYMPAPSKETMIVLCGPPPMIKIMVQYLTNLGYSKEMYHAYV